MVKPNWDNFKAKFSENPQGNFVWFCYLLFCHEFKMPAGIFRYKNQSGIETNPITKDNEIIGYQFVSLGKMTDFIKKGDDPNTAWEKAKGQYGRVADAVKIIDPRKE